MTSRRRTDCPRGEPFAERSALEQERLAWPRFKERFGDPNPTRRRARARGMIARRATR